MRAFRASTMAAYSAVGKLGLSDVDTMVNSPVAFAISRIICS
jgi:hypothetical protein